MKIAQVINFIGTGGSGTLVYNLSIDLAKRGHSVDIILLNSFSGDNFEENTLRRLNKSAVRTIAIGRRPGYNLDFPNVLSHLRNLHKANNYDIMHSHSHVCHFFIGLLRKLLSFEHVITVHNSRETWSAFTRFLCKTASMVFCSEAAAKGSIKAINSLVINNGVKFDSTYLIDMKELSLIRNDLGIPMKDKLIIGVGNLRKQKNYGLALETIGKLSRCSTKHHYHYIVCGDGPERAFLESIAQRLDLTKHVSFIGVRSDVARLLSVSDCFLSTSEFEGLPMAVLEALASGICCVLSPIPEHENIAVGMACCSTAMNMDADSFAHAIISSTENTLGKHEIRHKRDIALQKFSWDHCLAAYESLYKDVL